jgi:hypothetical protein
MTETSPKPFVFVLMPFDSAFDYVYQLGIKPACSEAGAYAERVDEQQYDERILDRIYNQIAKADLIVADMTGRNANVFYETGYAHALDKRVILLTQKANDIPFDLKHHPHIVYDGKITNLIPELHKRVKWALDNPKDSISNLSSQLEVIVDEVTILDNPVVECIRWNKHYFEINVDIHNPVEKEIKMKLFQIAIITPLTTNEVRIRSTTLQRTKISAIPISNEKGYIHYLYEDHKILPGSCLTNFRFDSYPTTEFLAGNTHQLALRIFSSGLPLDYPFRVELVPKLSTKSQ